MAEGVCFAEPEWVPGGGYQQEAPHVAGVAGGLKAVLVALQEELHLVPEKKKKTGQPLSCKRSGA